MSTTAASPAAAPEPEPLSAVGRILNIFTAPSKTFLDLKRKATWTSWVAPWFLSAIFAWIFVVVMAQKIGFEQISENQLRLQPKQAEQIEKLPPEQRAQQMKLSLAITKGISYGIPFMSLIFLAIVALILMATFNFGVGAELSFKLSLAIVMYASLPGIIKSVLGIVAMFAGLDPEGFYPQNPVATNPGYFLNPMESPVLYQALTAVDVITIWMLVLTAIGFSTVSKMSKGTTMAVVFGWYIAVTLFGTAMAAIFR
jgi:hypothetical protein